MSLFVVDYAHHEGDDPRNEYAAHVEFLEKLLASPVLRAAGPFRGTQPASAMTIFSGRNREEVLAIIKTDPFVTGGHIGQVTVTEWDPVLGDYQDQSSRSPH